MFVRFCHQVHGARERRDELHDQVARLLASVDRSKRVLTLSLLLQFIFDTKKIQVARTQNTRCSKGVNMIL